MSEKHNVTEQNDRAASDKECGDGAVAIVENLDQELDSARQDADEQRQRILERRNGFWGKLFGRISA